MSGDCELTRFPLPCSLCVYLIQPIPFAPNPVYVNVLRFLLYVIGFILLKCSLEPLGKWFQLPLVFSPNRFVVVLFPLPHDHPAGAGHSNMGKIGPPVDRSIMAIIRVSVANNGFHTGVSFEPSQRFTNEVRFAKSSGLINQNEPTELKNFIRCLPVFLPGVSHSQLAVDHCPNHAFP